MSNADNAFPLSQPIRVAKLPLQKPWAFSISPDRALCDVIARDLGISSVRKLTFKGEISATSEGNWRLIGRLGATVVQPCRTTLAPVTTRIDETIERNFIAQPPEFEPGSETQMPEDDTQEPLGNSIDPGQIMVEALALALPPFPRAPDAELEENTFTEPGKTAMSDAEARPFSALKSLRDKLAGDDG